MKAAVRHDLIAVTPSYRPSIGPNGSHFLTVEVPNGWDDVKKISKKILEFEGRFYTFTGWNSDSMKCYFRESTQFAKLK